VVIKACQENPAVRYQSAKDMYADLELLQSGQSVATPSSAPTSPLYQPIELVIRDDLESFTPAKRKTLMEAISKLLDIGGPIMINQIRRGSTILTLALTPIQAQRLLKAVQEGALRDLGVIEARYPEPASHVGEHDPKQAQRRLTAVQKGELRDFGLIEECYPEGASHVREHESAAEFPIKAGLLNRLRKDEASWDHFVGLYSPLIYQFASKAGLTDPEVQDVVQETMSSAAKHLPTFQGDPTVGAFKAWLFNMTRWRVVDQLRKRGPFVTQDSGSDETEATEDMLAPKAQALDELWNIEWNKALQDAATANVKRRLDPRKYQIFDCYVNKEWPSAKVAAAFGISVDQVYLAKHRVAALIKQEVKRLEKEIT
jgi:RNA polymerase sigma-70 factor (ECF subfamily)